MEPKIFTLKNGLRVLLIDTKAFPTLSAVLFVAAGSRYENEVNNGIAHFFEHMAFKGSKKYENSHIIASEVEGLGGIFNAFTNKDNTAYWIKATNQHIEKLTDVLSDMVLTPKLLDEEIEREKGVIIEELNLYNDTPYTKVSEIFETLLYPDNPLGFEIGGHKNTVTKFNRKTFTDYMSALYNPKNSIYVIAGGLNEHLKNTDKLLNMIEEKFKDWEDGKAESYEKLIEKQTKPQLKVIYKKTEQSHFVLGFRAFSRMDNRKYALSVLSVILGGGMSSRLFKEVRERRGLCYYVSTSNMFYNDAGNITSRAGVTIDIEKTKQAVDVMLKEHKKIIKGEITKDEIERAKEMIKGRFLLSLEDSFDVANYFGIKLLLEGKITDVNEYINKINKVSYDEIISVAKQVFKLENLNMAIIGPVKESKNLERILTI
jgi:predicted Zn-dependent peptidase